ncbi:BMC domain-containing protein [Halanaerobium sp. ST460_2HS_T2]|uniref:BMC domain-containing protein n=1 Tax=Halanaerobium sp. ST460_2HS_T2 TaxID=2183914 RepID=UPI000DF1EB98|nr:BMC domain-containing protein [Halanaerobium sp. ST460_2HS_T2]RCW61060.1 microcompartment protein CcmL/EutN [Halanaerobium sp. ST460_2HS_T2]
MNRAVGLLEFNSIAAGIEIADLIVKSAHIELLQAQPVCPGKYVAMFHGEVGSVKSAVETGQKESKEFFVDSFILANVHQDVIPALTGAVQIGEVKALGVIETFSVASAIVAADLAAKTAQIRLLEVRTAMGMGGKAVLTFTGDIGSVEIALGTAAKNVADKGLLVKKSFIPSVHKDLMDKLL